MVGFREGMRCLEIKWGTPRSMNVWVSQRERAVSWKWILSLFTLPVRIPLRIPCCAGFIVTLSSFVSAWNSLTYGPVLKDNAPGIVLLFGNCLLPVLKKTHSGFPDFGLQKLLWYFSLWEVTIFFLAAFSIASLLHFLVMEKVSGKV